MLRSLRPPTPWIAWLLFAALLLGQLGAGLAASMVTGAQDDCCPSEQVAEGAAADAVTDGPADAAAEHDLCPPGCDHCTCCASVLAVLTAWSDGFAQPPPAEAVGLQPPGDPGAGVLPRVYRPPQPALG